MNLLDQFSQAEKKGNAEIPSEEMTGCCLRAWQKEALAGRLAGVDTWHCVQCGCEWQARTVDRVRTVYRMRLWECRSSIEVLRPRGR